MSIEEGNNEVMKTEKESLKMSVDNLNKEKDDLKNLIDTLNIQKENLKKQIEDLEGNIDKIKSDNEKYIQDKESENNNSPLKKMEQLFDTFLDEKIKLNIVDLNSNDNNNSPFETVRNSINTVNDSVNRL